VLAKMGYRVVRGTAMNRAEQVYADAEARAPIGAVASWKKVGGVGQRGTGCHGGRTSAALE
jgi:hypothetical protein